MKKTLISLCVLVLLSINSLAFGMGVITDMDFGEVEKGSTTEKEFRFFPFDTDYQPYTDVPADIEVNVDIKTEGCQYISYEVNNPYPINQYSSVPVTLTVPKNARKGDYSCKICAYTVYSPNGIGFNVGACTDLTYSVKSKSLREENRFIHNSIRENIKALNRRYFQYMNVE